MKNWEYPSYLAGGASFVVVRGDAGERRRVATSSLTG